MNIKQLKSFSVFQNITDEENKNEFAQTEEVRISEGNIFIKEGEVNEGILNFEEMAHRNYDQCLACDTHAYPGYLPIQVEVYTKDKKLLKKLRNF